MPVIFFASFALERMGVSSDSVGGSHAGYRQSLRRGTILLYLQVSPSSSFYAVGLNLHHRKFSQIKNPFDPASLFYDFLFLSTLLNTLDCAGNHALSSHFTGAIVSKALEVSSALRDHLILVGAQRDSMWNTVGFFVKYVSRRNFECFSTFPSLLSSVTP